ncbi:hypothetical protein PhCBS80983_g06529, partial [Powellomyces hirtus]
CTYSEATGVEDFKTLCEEHDTPETLTVKTPSGGEHRYYTLSGNEKEEKLKNWTSCMTLNNKLIAVDNCKHGGYVMCPASKKGSAPYTWTTKDEFKAPMAQEYTSEPIANTDVDDEDIERFKKSEFWQDYFQIALTPDANNIYIITATGPYDLRHKSLLRFVCRAGKGCNRVIEVDYETLWEESDPLYKDLLKSNDGTDRALSVLMLNMLHNAVCATANKDVWKLFETYMGVWREEDKHVIMRPVFDHCVAKFKELSHICSKLSKGNENKWSYRATLANKVWNLMSSTGPKENILKSLYKLIWDNRNDDKFNKKGNLLHCTTGVYDLTAEIFCPAEPGDMSTQSTKLTYMPYSEHPEEKRQLVEGFLLDIMNNDMEMCEFLKRALASSLDGYVIDQLFYMFLGKGANGKSLLIKLLKLVLGDYASSMASAQVTKTSVNAQAASPALIALLHKRASFLTELEEKVLVTEFIKMVAGGDRTTGRGLHKENQEIELTSKIFIALNDLPTVEDKTHGFWRKLVIIPFKASFVDDPKLPHEKPIIPGYEAKLLACADTFLAMLIDTYVKHYKHKRINKAQLPAVARQMSIDYQFSQNIPLQFITLATNDSENEHIISTDLSEAFSNFCKSKSVQKNRNMVEQLYKIMDEKYPPTNKERRIKVNKKARNGWSGVELQEKSWKIVKDEESEDNDEEE